MTRTLSFLAALAALAAAPVLAQEDAGPRSEAGTAFMQHCIADVTGARVALLQRKAPEFAATLSAEDLAAGARQKALRACPCFLHVIGISPAGEGGTPEEKVAVIVAHLDAVHTGETPAIPPVLGTIAKNCGERTSVIPPLWYGR